MDSGSVALIVKALFQKPSSKSPQKNALSQKALQNQKPSVAEGFLQRAFGRGLLEEGFWKRAFGKGLFLEGFWTEGIF